MRATQPISLAILLCLGAFAACARKGKEPQEPPVARVTGVTVSFPANSPQLAYLTVRVAEQRRLAITHLTGRLYLSEDATVRIFTPVSGQVMRSLAEVGQPVAAGAPLAEISSPEFGQAQADARSADAALTAADQALSRAKDLFKHGAAAQKDVELAQATDASACAERDRAGARLKLYHGSESGSAQRYVLRSPLAGVVVEKNINPGQEVRADQMLANATALFAPLFVVSDPSRLWLQVDASETDLAELESGQKIQVASNAFPGRVFSGSIASIGPSLDPATRTARVRGVVDNPDSLLKAEMYVSVDVVRDESRVSDAGVEIASKAIFMIDRKSYLFVETAPGNFERREVQTGTEKDDRVPVLRGVAPGERVVTEGALLLQAVLDPAN